MLILNPHPLLDLAALVAAFAPPLGETVVLAARTDLLRADDAAPLTSNDAARGGAGRTSRATAMNQELLR